MGVNKVILLGNVGADPEVKYLEGGTCVASVRLATSETYKNKNGEKITNTEWHNIVLWRGLGEITEKYVKKGSQLYIEGKIKTRTWDDKDGIKRYTTDIVADSMQMIGKAVSSESETKSSAHDSLSVKDAGPADFEVEAQDDLPF